MAGAIAVPKRKGLPKGDSGERETFVRIRMSPEFKEWLQSYSDSRNRTMSAALVEAVIAEAESRGFEKPPKR